MKSLFVLALILVSFFSLTLTDPVETKVTATNKVQQCAIRLWNRCQSAFIPNNNSNSPNKDASLTLVTLRQDLNISASDLIEAGGQTLNYALQVIQKSPDSFVNAITKTLCPSMCLYDAACEFIKGGDPRKCAESLIGYLFPSSNLIFCARDYCIKAVSKIQNETNTKETIIPFIKEKILAKLPSLKESILNKSTDQAFRQENREIIKGEETTSNSVTTSISIGRHFYFPLLATIFIVF